MATTVTLPQILKFAKLLDDKNVTSDRFQNLLGSGLLSDVLDVDAAYLDSADRKAVQKIFERAFVCDQGFTKFGPTNYDYLQALKKAGIRVDGDAEKVLSRMDRSFAGELVAVYKITPRRLGFVSNATYAEVCERGVEMGLKLCAEMGPILGIRTVEYGFTDRELFIAMSPVRIQQLRGETDFVFFYRESTAKRGECGKGELACVYPSHVCTPNDEFMFVKD